MKEYLKLKLPVVDKYDANYWFEVAELNQKELDELGIEILTVWNAVSFSIELKEFYMPDCKYNEVEKIQRHYEIIQQIAELETEDE